MTRISPSKAGRWLQCERRACHENSHPPPVDGAEHVAAYVGTLAHAMLADTPAPAWPEVVLVDEITPNYWAAESQAAEISVAARDALAKEGWQVLDREREVSDRSAIPVRGTLDLLVRREIYGRAETAIVDLKTGDRALWAWLQLGLYVVAARWALEELADLHPDRLSVGVLHIPRRDVLHGTPAAKVVMRPAAAVEQDAEIAADRIEALMDGSATPVPMPGTHCESCPLRSGCPVSSYGGT